MNRVGVSDPSDATEPILLKASKAPPSIDRSQFPDGTLICKVNQQLVLEVPVEGVPSPTTTWYKNDSELSTGGGIKVASNVNPNYSTAKLMFIPSLRPLTGKYTLKAKNQVCNICKQKADFLCINANKSTGQFTLASFIKIISSLLKIYELSITSETSR